MKTLGSRPLDESYYEFDGFRLAIDSRYLWHGEEFVPLTAKAVETLFVLIENNRKLVTKDALLESVWPNTFVEESTLAQNISTLRKAFSSTGSSIQFIETVPKKGYRFLRDVRLVLSKDEELELVETVSSRSIVAERTEIHDTNEPDPTSTILKPDPTSTILKYVYGNLFRTSFFVLAVGVLLAGGLILFRGESRSAKERFTLANSKPLLTTSDLKLFTISPDRKYLAIVAAKDGRNSLQLRLIDRESTVEIIPPSEDEYIGIAFSPNGDSIYYTVRRKLESSAGSGFVGILLKVPLFGGSSIEIRRNIESRVAVSPDEKMLAFVRYSPETHVSNVILSEIAGTTNNETLLSSRPIREGFSSDSLSWSPDGKFIAGIVSSSNEPERPMQPVTIDVSTSEIRIVTRESWKWAGNISWFDNGRELVFLAYDINSPNMTDDLLIVNLSDGSLVRVASDLNGVLGIGVSGDSQSVFAVRSNRASSLLVGAAADPTNTAVVDKSFGDNSIGNLGIDWTPDGRIVYSRVVDGNADLWIVKPDGSLPIQLTTDRRADFSPVVSPNGDHIVFISNRSGTNSLLRMNLDGTGIRELTKAQDVSSPSISADGLAVYYAASDGRSRFPVLWRVSENGGEPTRVTTLPFILPQASPTGEFILGYYPHLDAEGKSLGSLVPSIIAPDGKRIIRQFPEAAPDAETPLLWMADGESFSFIKTSNNTAGIWRANISGGLQDKPVNFQTEQIFRFRWSRDGSKVAFEKGIVLSEIVHFRASGD